MIYQVLNGSIELNNHLVKCAAANYNVLLHVKFAPGFRFRSQGPS